MSADDEVAAEWLSVAESDLAAANKLSSADFGDAVLYHCQQSAEKAVKAFLASQRQRNQKTHDIPRLLRQAESLSPGFATFIDDAAWVCDRAFRYRYPDRGELEFPDSDDEQRGLQLATDVLSFVKSRLPPPEDEDED